jgi:pimeloyl-ACP methyl ester carboxylesterase
LQPNCRHKEKRLPDPKFETQNNQGIERVVCRPVKRTHNTPILFQHGMWHAAWCWRSWQKDLANKGWESHAISLPGHGKSARRKSVRFSTMQDYLTVLETEIARTETPPFVVGHSMGGALIQWYLSKTADDLPGAVLLGSWTSHSTYADGTVPHLKRDPWGFIKMGLTLSSTPLVRSPKWTKSLLITDGAEIEAAELHGRLCEESAIVLSQHNPPMWSPKKNLKSPVLWVAGEQDAVITLAGARRSAEFYNAKFLSVPDAGHNLMMEHNSAATLDAVESWLSQL